MMAIELCAPGTTTPDAARAAAVNAFCHQAGVVTLTCGTWGNVFRFLPPLSIGDDLLSEAFDVVAEAFAADRAETRVVHQRVARRGWSSRAPPE